MPVRRPVGPAPAACRERMRPRSVLAFDADMRIPSPAGIRSAATVAIGAARSALHVAGVLGRRIGQSLGRAVTHLDGLVAAAVASTRRRWSARDARRHAHLRRRNRVPLPNLFEVHPDARNLTRRELGLRSIPLDEIAGTAVAGAAQRGSDFLPLPAFRSSNWGYRFQAIQNAMRRLAILPPIDVLRYDGRYWVEDGHNRVAAALYAGQIEIDATVTELRAAGAHSTEAPASLAPVLQAGRDLRAAGEGRFTATAGEVVTADDVEEAAEEQARLRAGESGAVSAPDVHGT